MNKFSEIFKDNAGKYSGTSIAKLSIVFSIMAMWILFSIHEMKMVRLHEEFIWLIGVSLFGGVANKAIKPKAGEMKQEQKKTCCRQREN